MAKEKQEIVFIEKTCRVDLDGGGVKMKIGDFYLRTPAPGPRPEDFADAAFNSARSSLRKLMVPLYRLIVFYDDQEAAYGLGRWIKLHDGTKDNVADAKGKKKTPIHKRGVAV